MPPKTDDIDNVPLTIGTITTWGAAIVAVLTMVIGGVGAFDHLGNRIDLSDQKIQTLLVERIEMRSSRDEQIKGLNSRCDSLDRNCADLTHALSDVTARLAVIQAREEDALTTLQKIDNKVNAK